MKKNTFSEIHRLTRAGMFREALARLYDLGHTIDAGYTDDLNHAWYLVGDCHFKLGEFDDAVVAFANAIVEQPADHMALMAHANACMEAGHPAEAVLSLRQALELRPGDANLIYNLGNALFDERKYRDAMREYSRIPVLNSDIAESARLNIDVCRRRIATSERRARRRRQDNGPIGKSIDP